MTDEPTAPVRAEDLPLDLDHASAADLQHRVRSLTSAEVEQLLAYERGHAHRPQVVMVLEARLRQLAAGAEPTGGDPSGGATPPAPDASGPVSPETQVDAVRTTPHGDPTNPGQPR